MRKLEVLVGELTTSFLKAVADIQWTSSANCKKGKKRKEKTNLAISEKTNLADIKWTAFNAWIQNQQAYVQAVMNLIKQILQRSDQAQARQRPTDPPTVRQQKTSHISCLVNLEKKLFDHFMVRRV